jgi:hypothetical protein
MHFYTSLGQPVYALDKPSMSACFDVAAGGGLEGLTLGTYRLFAQSIIHQAITNGGKTYKNCPFERRNVLKMALCHA